MVLKNIKYMDSRQLSLEKSLQRNKPKTFYGISCFSYTKIHRKIGTDSTILFYRTLDLRLLSRSGFISLISYSNVENLIVVTLNSLTVPRYKHVKYECCVYR